MFHITKGNIHENYGEYPWKLWWKNWWMGSPRDISWWISVKIMIKNRKTNLILLVFLDFLDEWDIFNGGKTPCWKRRGVVMNHRWLGNHGVFLWRTPHGENIGVPKWLISKLIYARWCPSSLAKLVYKSNFTMVYGTYYYSYWGL